MVHELPGTSYHPALRLELNPAGQRDYVLAAHINDTSQLSRRWAERHDLNLTWTSSDPKIRAKRPLVFSGCGASCAWVATLSNEDVDQLRRAPTIGLGAMRRFEDTGTGFGAVGDGLDAVVSPGVV